MQITNVMGHGMIEFVGVVMVVSSVLDMSVGIHDAARQRLQGKWKDECPLEAHSVNPWLVKVWDIDYGLTMSHGSIVAHRVVLSTCSGFADANLRLSQYRLIGQNVLGVNASGIQCIQLRNVEQLVLHPGCSRSEDLKGEPRSVNFVNLAVWIVKGHFVSADGFPGLTFPRDRDTFLSDVRKLEAEPDNPGCILPVFTSRNQMDSYFAEDTKVSLIPYITECVEMMCKDAQDKEACQNLYSTEGIRMCVVPKWTKKTPNFGEPDIDWYYGSPLVCNDVAYGIATQVVSRSNYRKDFYLTTSFVEHTSWIKNMVDKFESLPSEKEYDEKERPDDSTQNPDKEETAKPQEARKSSRAALNYYHPSSSTFSIIASITICLLW